MLEPDKLKARLYEILFEHVVRHEEATYAPLLTAIKHSKRPREFHIAFKYRDRDDKWTDVKIESPSPEEWDFDSMLFKGLCELFDYEIIDPFYEKYKVTIKKG